MMQVKVIYDQTGNTLIVWFGNPQDEVVAEEKDFFSTETSKFFY